MKKIFAISVLSLLAVVATGDCAFAVRSEPFFTAGRVDQAIRRATNGMLTHEDIISPSETSTSPDYDAPSVSRMENTVNAAVATKVNNSQVVAKAGDAELATYAAGVQAGTVTAASAQNNNIANVNAVAANFVPNEAQLYDYDYQEVYGEPPSGAGDYVLTVSVDNAGNKVYVWRAMKIGYYHTSAGGNFAPI